MFTRPNEIGHKISIDKPNWLNNRKGETEDKRGLRRIRCSFSLSCLSLSPPKQQFFNCAIDEIRFPVCLASLPCSICVCGPYRLPYQGYRPTVHLETETARESQDSTHLILLVARRRLLYVWWQDLTVLDLRSLL